MHIKTLLHPRSILIGALLFTIVATAAFLTPATSIPSIRIKSPIAIDKIVHVGVHFILVLSWLIYYARHKLSVKNASILYIALACVGYGIVIEVLQGMTKTRGSELGDVIANMIGTGLGVLVFLLLKSKIEMKA